MRVEMQEDGSEYRFPFEQDGYAIYAITNKVNGKVYVGQTTRPCEQRWEEHKYNTRYDTEKCAIHYAFDKYGLNNFIFELVATFIYSFDELNQKEQEFIYLFDSYENGYNETLGGDGVKKYTKQEIDECKKAYENNGISGIMELGYSYEVARGIVRSHQLHQDTFFLSIEKDGVIKEFFSKKEVNFFFCRKVTCLCDRKTIYGWNVIKYIPGKKARRFSYLGHLYKNKIYYTTEDLQKGSPYKTNNAAFIQWKLDNNIISLSNCYYNIDKNIIVFPINSEETRRITTAIRQKIRYQGCYYRRLTKDEIAQELYRMRDELQSYTEETSTKGEADA